MTSKNEKHQAPEAMTELHRLIGMTPEQVRQDLVDQGINPESEIQALRRLGRVMAAKYANQIENEATLPAELYKPFHLYDEAVAAGQPAWAGAIDSGRSSSIIEVLRHSDSKDVIMANVTGWSMRDEGINDGDVVLVDTKAEPKDGDIVLAHISGQGQVVKRLKISETLVTLESANPDFASIIINDSANLKIHGVVVGRLGKV